MLKCNYCVCWQAAARKGWKAAAAAVASPLVSSVVRRWVLSFSKAAPTQWASGDQSNGRTAPAISQWRRRSGYKCLSPSPDRVGQPLHLVDSTWSRDLLPLSFLPKQVKGKLVLSVKVCVRFQDENGVRLFYCTMLDVCLPKSFENIYLSAGQIFPPVAFWRCDSFLFSLRVLQFAEFVKFAWFDV